MNALVDTRRQLQHELNHLNEHEARIRESAESNADGWSHAMIDDYFNELQLVQQERTHLTALKRATYLPFPLPVPARVAALLGSAPQTIDEARDSLLILSSRANLLDPRPNFRMSSYGRRACRKVYYQVLEAEAQGYAQVCLFPPASATR